MYQCIFTNITPHFLSFYIRVIVSEVACSGLLEVGAGEECIIGTSGLFSVRFAVWKFFF